MYELRFDPISMNKLEKLPRTTAQRILRKLQDTRQDPYRYFRKLTNRPEYRLRVGQYRIFADIDDGEIAILVLDARHRKSAYR